MKKVLDLFEKIKYHLPYLGILILLSFFFLVGWFNFYELPVLDHTSFYLPRAEILKRSFEMGHIMPLWNPYIMGGTPLYAQPAFIAADTLITPLLLIFKSPVAAVKLMYFIDIVLAGVFMYVLGWYLFKSRKAAFTSALLYIINGFVVKYYSFGTLATINQYPFLPLVMLFFIKAFKSKNLRDTITNSVFTAIILSVQLRAGPDMKIILWSSLMLGLYSLFYLFGKNIKKSVFKIVIIGCIILVLFAGLTAQKTLITNEYLKSSSRETLSYEQSSGRSIKIGDLFFRLVEPLNEKIKPFKDGANEQIGIIAFLLAVFGLYKKRRNKFVLFLSAIILLSLLIVIKTPIYYLIWKFVPLFKSMRYLERSLILFIFPIVILAGYGISELLKKIKEKGLNKIKSNIIFISIILFIMLNLMVFGYAPYEKDALRDIDAMTNDNKILEAISQKEGHFRYHIFEQSGIDWSVDFFSTALRINSIYGYETAWYPPYFNTYLGLSTRSPLKMWGILNTKYIVSMQELNISGLKLIGKYPKCGICPPFFEQYERAYGPYLYENELSLPRVSIFKNAALIVGEKDAVTQLIYSLILDNGFDHKKFIVVKGKEKINDYDIEELKKYKAVFLTQGSVDPNSNLILKQYVDLGGILMPDVTKGENSLDDKKLNKLLNSMDEELITIPDKSYVMHNFDRYELNLNKSINGFLVFSEKFSVFPGWEAKLNGKEKEILNADAMISTVYLDNEYGNIIFEYKPKSYIIGTWITIIAVFIVILYFIFYFKNKKKKNKQPQLKSGYSEL